MKNLILVGGPMGVGKTTACRILKEKLDRCVFLDGDWCWDMHPFSVTEETKRMVMENIAFLLNNFLGCSEIDTVLFCWVMHRQSILDDLLSRVPAQVCRPLCVTLTCTEDALRRRLLLDVERGLRQPDVVERAVSRLRDCASLATVKIDATQRNADEVADAIAALIP
jgi:broad-specificity NMP kinase